MTFSLLSCLPQDIEVGKRYVSLIQRTTKVVPIVYLITVTDTSGEEGVIATCQQINGKSVELGKTLLSYADLGCRSSLLSKTAARTFPFDAESYSELLRFINQEPQKKFWRDFFRNSRARQIMLQFGRGKKIQDAAESTLPPLTTLGTSPQSSMTALGGVFRR